METRSGRAVCPPGWHHEYDIEDQQAASVKHSMSGHLGHFRSSLEKFKKAVCQQKSVAMVEYCLNDVQEAYKSLSQAHDVYVSLEVDPSRLQLSQSQLRDASEQLEAARVACGAYQLEPSTSTPAALDQNRRPFSDISPSDSVSQSGSGSRTSRASQSSSAMRAKAAARKAALLARSKFVAQRQNLELKELQVKQEMDVLDLEGQIKEAEAEESVLNMLSGSDHSFTNTADCQGDSGMKVSELNPLALEWVSGNLPPVSVPSVSVPVVSVPAVSGGVPVMDMLDLNLGVTALNGGAVSSVGVPGVGGAVSSVGVPGVGGAVSSVSVPGVGGAVSSVGVPGVGGAVSSVGVPGVGGAVSSVSVPGVGGAVSSVGVPGVGGAVSSVSVPGVGGAVSSVGVLGVGGAVSSVGVPGVGGAVSSVGVPGVGGAVSSVGVPGVGGAVSSVGVPGVGGAVSSVGVPGVGGAVSSVGVPPVAMSMVSGHMPSVNGGVSDKVVIEPTGAAEIPAWFQPVMERVISAVHNCGVQTTDDQRHTFAESGHAHMQRQLLDAVSLPKSTLMSYSGDPSSYWVFVNAFDSSVGNLAVDDSVKLSRLIECCTGKAAKVIRPCALMVPAEGYVRARQLLAERFGSEFLVSEACINKVVTGPPVRPNNGEALQEFTDELRCCVETLNAMGRLNEVEDRSRMVALVQRLPLYIQGRWRKEAVHTLDRIGRYPGVQQLVTFLDKVSREVNDPVFGPLEFKGKKDVKPQKMTGSRSFNVVADNKGRKSGGSAGPKSGHSGGTDYKAKSPLSCLVCQGSHMLSSCKKFQGLDPVKRFEVVKQKRLCFLCLEGTGHGAYQCPKAGNCSVGSCNGKHHMLLHEVLGKAKAKVTQARDEGPKGQDQSAELQSKCYSNSCKSSQSGKGRVGLPIVPVKIRGVGGDKCIVVHALLDPGSNRSFCSQALMLQLGLEGRSTQVSLETLSATGETEAIEIALEASSCTGRQCKKKVVVLPGVLALKKFPDLGGSCIAVSDVKCYEHLNDLPLKSVSSSGIHLIVGQDVPHALMPLEVRYGAEGEPYGVRTALGWTVSGPVSGGESEPEVAISHYVQVAPQSVADTELSTQVERFWKIDVGQELAGGSLAASLEDRRALKVWDESVQRHEGHYVLDMPLRSESTDWPSEASKVTAERRLSSLKKRLMRDSDYHAKYNTEMQKLLDKGYAEPVPVSESVCQDGPSWYLPHHNVKNPNKPEKFRVVFDCAAQSGGTSLNKEVLQGPDMTNKLVGVLTRFRQHPVAIMADIEAMFYQVKVSMHHRNALKFLWWEDGDLEKVPQVYRMAVHLFGGVWSPSCAAYALRRTAQDHASKYHPETVKTVLGNFYVDDCLKSIRDTEFGKRLVNELVNLLDDGGFNLTDWVSNDLSVLESVPEENRAKSVKLFDLNSREMPVERALGVRWSTEDDTLGVKVKTRETPCTRRGVLSLISSVYDPLGIVSPFILKGKLLLQSECRSGKGWDDRLGPEAEAAWQKWLQELPKLELYKVERCLLPSRFTLSDKMVLHHFSDASQVAYGVVSYLRSENHEGDVWCGFVMAKSRLAPLKTMTIPRLELSAAALAVKVDAMLRRELELQVTDSVFWTDSMIVLQYICSTSRRFQTFVANRVALIHDGSDPSQWRYVKSEQNPADDASRGLTADEMLNKERWAKGPEFLWGQESQWPEKPAGLPEPPVDDKEVKIKVQVFTTSVEDSEKAFDRLLRQFSSWFRLKRAVAWMMRFGAWLQSHKHVVLERRLSVNELQTAERAVLRYIQGKHFPAEVDSVVHGKSVCRQSSIQSLAPRLNAGLLVVGGRLQNAPISEESKYPAILPREDSVTKLIVRDIHEGEAVHGGREYVLGLLRCKYWIPQARPLISRVLRECVVCKRLRCMPGQQKMADLPFDRVTPGQRPFANCGVDCFGPYAVKRGRSTEKRYGCLFTCLCMRAIHIEKLHTMDADSFINALVRFMARRGVPDRIRSDNGTNFVGGERELRESMREWDKSDKVQGLLASKSIEWVFNPPAAPHMGGVWERQVKSVKRALSVILRDQVVDDERLDTLFCEAEAVVNGRPLTVVSDDPSDLKVLTPNDLLLLSGIPPRVPLGKFAKEDRYTRRWRHVQYLGDLFWKRWVKEYLPTLQLRQRWLNEQPNFRVDDVVLVMCENTPRRSWPLGRVSRVFPGKDGLVRSVELQTQDSVLVRPVDRLCLLEGASVSSDK